MQNAKLRLFKQTISNTNSVTITIARRRLKLIVTQLVFRIKSYLLRQLFLQCDRL